MTLKKELKTISIVYSIALLVIAVASAVVAIIDGVKGWGISSHPILTFIFILCAGISLLLLIGGIVRKYVWHIFCGAGLFILALFYAGFDVFKFDWWINLIIAFALIFVFVGISVIIAGKKTEEIALNDHVEYKDYKQRQAEKLEAEKLAESEQGPMPELKTFTTED
jgi:hypothetical protein